MSTIGYTSWAVDLADVGAIYPFQGWEVAMTIIGVLFWLWWHRAQFVKESKDLERAKQRGLNAEKVTKSIDRY